MRRRVISSPCNLRPQHRDCHGVSSKTDGLAMIGRCVLDLGSQVGLLRVGGNIRLCLRVDVRLGVWL